MTTPHTEAQAREIVSDALLAIVPDAPLSTMDDEQDLRDTLELDSLDFLNFVERLAALTGIRIDEDDYPKLRTMAGCTLYLREHAA